MDNLEKDLKARTKAFAVAMLKVVDSPPTTPSGRAVAGQLARSGTSVAANYRAACRARSRKEFIAKLGVVEEEADETAFWIEIGVESGMLDDIAMAPHLQEADELTAIAVSSIKTSRSRQD
jgi:four helix bundle protein